MNWVLLLYLGAPVAANLIVSRFGPDASILTAFALIGCNLVARDHLHDRWHGPYLWPRMAALVLTGSAISYLLGAGQIAVASALAFLISESTDAIAYALLGERARMLRVNGSNVVSAAVDSLVFPWLAFGAILPVVTAGQYVAKVGGGAVWSLVLGGWRDLSVGRGNRDLAAG